MEVTFYFDLGPQEVLAKKLMKKGMLNESRKLYFHVWKEYSIDIWCTFYTVEGQSLVMMLNIDGEITF